MERQQVHSLVGRFINPHQLAVALATTLGAIAAMNAMFVVVALNRSPAWIFWLFVAGSAISYLLLRWRAGYAEMMLRASLLAVPLLAAQVAIGLFFGGRFALHAESGSNPMPDWASSCLGTAFISGMALLGVAIALLCAFVSWIAVRSR